MWWIINLMVSIIDENSFRIHIKWNIIFWNQGVKETSASLQATSFELFFFLIILTSEN